jgi:hypothetical protein
MDKWRAAVMRLPIRQNAEAGHVTRLSPAPHASTAAAMATAALFR